MGTSVGTYVIVQVDHVPEGRSYKAAGFTYSFRPSSSGVSNYDVQTVSVQVQNGARLYYKEYSGALSGLTFNWQGDAITGNFAPQGQRHEFVVANTTWDSKGDSRFYAQAWATGYSFYTPRLNAGMFTNGTATATSRNITYTGLDTPQSERLSYQNWDATGYRQNSPGTKNGSVNYSGLPANTKQDLAFGMIAQNSDDGYLGNGDARRVLVPVYPAYKTVSKGATTAARVVGTPESIRVSWGAWNQASFGNMVGWKAEVQILNASTGAVIKTQGVNVYSAGNVTLDGIPLDIAVSVRIRVYGNYHDGVSINEYSTTETLGYLCNAWFKVNGTWRRGIRAYLKVNGTWRANNGLIRRKDGGVWK